MPFFLAVFTIAIDLELMVYGLEVEAFLQDRFQRFQEVVLAFPDFATAQADQVMVVVAIVFPVV